MKTEILREHYFFELNRKQQLESALALPVAAIAALIGILALYTKTILGATKADWHLIIPVGIAAVLFLTGLILTIRAFYGYKYSEIDAQGAATHYDKLMKYGAQIGEAPEKTEASFDGGLRGRYGEAVEKNRIQNQRRLWHLHWAKVALAATTIFLGYAAIPYFHRYSANNGEVQKEEATGEVSVRVIENQTSVSSGKERHMGTDSNKPSQGNGGSASGSEAGSGNPESSPSAANSDKPQRPVIMPSASGSEAGSGNPGSSPSAANSDKPQRPVMPRNIETRMEAPPPKPQKDNG